MQQSQVLQQMNFHIKKQNQMVLQEILTNVRKPIAY